MIVGVFKVVTGVMGCGKSTRCISDYYSLKYRGCNVVVAKSSLDTRDEGVIKSRNIEKSVKVDFLLNKNTAISVSDMIIRKVTNIMVDEAQFLTKEQVMQLYCISSTTCINVTLYGLRMSWLGRPFRSIQLAMSVADKLEEIEAMNTMGERLTHQIAMRDGKPVPITEDSGEVIVGDISSNSSNDSTKVSYITVTKEEFYKVYPYLHREPIAVGTSFVDGLSVISSTDLELLDIKPEDEFNEFGPDRGLYDVLLVEENEKTSAREDHGGNDSVKHIGD